MLCMTYPKALGMACFGDPANVELDCAYIGIHFVILSSHRHLQLLASSAWAYPSNWLFALRENLYEQGWLFHRHNVCKYQGASMG